MPSRERRRSSVLLSITSSILLLASFLAVVQPAIAQADPLPDIQAPEPMPAPLEEAERVPDPAPIPQLGDPSPAITDVSTDDASTPQEAIANLLATGGGGTVQLYQTSPGSGTHIALVQPGSKADFGSLSRSGAGWTGTLGQATVFFPRHLAPDSGIGWSVPQGQMTVAPEGIAKTTGQEHPTAINYTAAATDTDYFYSLAAGGYKEQVELYSSKASTALSWLAASSELSLSLSSGVIVISAGSTQVGSMAAPLIQDVRGTAVTGTYTLTPVSTGVTRISLVIPPDFLAQATYPIVVDPGATSTHAVADTYVDSSSTQTRGASYENQNILKAGPTTRAFIRFDTSTLLLPGRLVYQADVMVHASSATTGASVAAQGITQTWPKPLTWDAQPTAGATIASSSATTGAFSTFHLAGLYQGYLGGSAVDNGVRLTSSSNVTFDSSETAGDFRPALVLAFNDLPAAPVTAGPTGTLQTQAPALLAQGIPTDLNRDQVMLRFQVSSSTDFADAHIITQSNWSPEASYQVTPGSLTNGGTYYWRIQARDVCDIQTGDLCSLIDGAGVTHVAPASSVQQITISQPHLGQGPAMTTEQLGDNISLGVNDSNGNLYLDMPLDMRQSPIGDISFGLSYNSQDASDIGLGAGWHPYAGPDGELPIHVQSVQSGAYVVMMLADGSERYFTQRTADSDDYLSTGAGTGTIMRAGDGTFAYNSDSGSFYFDSQGYLSTLRCEGTTPAEAASGAVLTYSFAQGRIQSVTDPVGAAIRFTWSAGSSPTLQQVSTADGAVFSVTASPYALSITDPANETFGVIQGAGKVSEVRDGAIVAGGGTGWQISYDGAGRVSSLLAPPGGASGSPAPWTFSYEGPFNGDLASTSYVTDPRGSATSVVGDYQVMYSFNTMGQVIREVGPADQYGYLPTTTSLYDSNGNLLCTRSPEANAVEMQLPRACGNMHDAFATDEVSTLYQYSDIPPYRMTKVIGQAASAGGQTATTDMPLDQGVPLGPKYATYSNLDLSQAPRYVGTWNTPLAHDYGSSGAPAGITAQGGWGISFSGYITNATTSAQNYKFRFYTQGGVRLVVADTTLLSCLDQAESAAHFNCGSDTNVWVTLPPGSWPMSIRYAKRSAQASFDFLWNAEGRRSLSTMQPADFAASLGLPTSSTSPEAEDGSQLQATSSFNSDSSQQTRLAQSTITTDGAGSRTEQTDYDRLGRLTLDTQAAGSADQSEMRYEYADPATQCVTREESPAGVVTDRVCDARGQITSEIVSVRATYDQPAQTRTTITTYDPMGRVSLVEGPGAARIGYEYDASGRVTIEDKLLDSSTHAVTAYAYDDAGRMITQTNPDGGVVHFTYDWVGNQLTSSDPRNPAWISATAYDAQGRSIRTTSASGLVSATNYRLSSSSHYVNTETSVDPAGVATVSHMDLLGQVVSSKTGSLAAAKYSFDKVGNQIRTIAPSGVITQDHYNAFGELSSSDTRVGGSPTRVSSYGYDARGNQITLDGPRAGDTTSFAYDKADRLISVTQQGLAAPNTTAYAYDDAGELVRVAQPMSASQTQVRTFAYDEAGNQVSITDSRGTTTSAYDAAGRLVYHTSAAGDFTAYRYDPVGRVTVRGAPPPYHRCNCRSFFTYDLAGNVTEALRDNVTYTASYDSEGRLESAGVRNSHGGGGGTDYTYDPSTGRLASLDTPAGTTAYSYDSNGSLHAVVDPFTHQATTFAYDPAGRLASRSDPTGDVLTQAYEPATGLVSSRSIKDASGHVLAAFALSYDQAGNVVSRSEHVASAAGGDTPGSGTWTYGYDGSNRMISATGPGNQETTYGYDNAGNRTSVRAGNATPVTTTYDAAGLAISSDGGTPQDAADDTTYINDASGRLVGIDAPGAADDRCYSYDRFDLLNGFSKGSTSGCDLFPGFHWGYDAFNRPSDKTYNTTTGTVTLDSYSYVGTSSELTQIATTTWYPSQRTATNYAGTPFGPLAQSDAAGTRFDITDLHGDLVGTVDASGAIAGSKLYSPWGEPQGSSGQGSTLGFQGQPTDADTGFVKTDTRLYDATQGRFTTQDSLFGDTQSPSSMNQFGYGEGNPVTMSDPSGMDSCRPAPNSPPQPGDNDSGMSRLPWSRSGTSPIKARICLIAAATQVHLQVWTRSTSNRVTEYRVMTWIWDHETHARVPGSQRNESFSGTNRKTFEGPEVNPGGQEVHACHASVQVSVWYDGQVKATATRTSGSEGC
jgi:RHS repeat-associated protein